MNDIYENGEYISNNPDWHLADSVWKAKNIIHILNRNKISPNSIYDVGCGAGGVLHHMHKVMPAHVVFYGYDRSEHAIRISRANENERLKFYNKDFLTERDLNADVILCIDVFEHVEDHFIFLRSIQKKGRYKIFHIPLDISVQSVLRASPIIAARKKTGHLHYFTKETALETLRDTGYKVIDFFYTPSALDLRYQAWWQQLAILPIRFLFRLNKDLTVRIFGGYSLMVLTE